MKILVSVGSLTAYRSYISSSKFQRLRHIFAHTENLKVFEDAASLKLPAYSKFQNLLYYLNQSGAFTKGFIKSKTFRMRFMRVISPTELLLIEGGGFKFYLKWFKNFCILLLNFINYIFLTHIWSNYLIKLVNYRYEIFLTKNQIDKVIIISTNQECELHLLALACEKLKINYSVLIDNWDNLSSKTMMTTNPTELLVWSQQIQEHARGIQGFTGSCKSIGSIRFEELKNYAAKHIYTIKKINSIYFCGSSVPSSEISFLEFLMENSDLKVVYRPHPVGFYASNKKALNRIKKLHEFYSNRMKVIYSTYGISPQEEMEKLSQDLISHRIVLCCPTSTFIESISLGIPTYILDWNEPDIINGVKTKPTSWFNKGYLHIHETIQEYPLKLTGIQDIELIKKVILNNQVELISLPFLKWQNEPKNKKFILANSNYPIDYP